MRFCEMLEGHSRQENWSSESAGNERLEVTANSGIWDWKGRHGKSA